MMLDYQTALCASCKFRAECISSDFGKGCIVGYEPKGLTNPALFRSVKNILLCGYVAYAGYLILSATLSGIRHKK